MATTRKIKLPLDEQLIQRARSRDAEQAGKADLEVIEHALTMYLGDRAFDEDWLRDRSMRKRPSVSRARNSGPRAATRRDRSSMSTSTSQPSSEALTDRPAS